jgi:hypothetical protein
MSGDELTVDVIDPTVARIIDAHHAFDASSTSDCLADDVGFVDVSGWRQTVETHGIEAFRVLATGNLAAFAEHRLTVLNCIATEQPCAVRVVYAARIAGDLPNGGTAGEDVELNGASVDRPSANRITELPDVC